MRGDLPRIELIAGEAALSVRGQRSCEVAAGSGRVDVADGDIEVRRLDAERVRVRCTAGTAHLRHPGGNIDLGAGQYVSYDAGVVQPVARMSQAASSWRQGVVVVRDLSLRAGGDEISSARRSVGE